MLHELVLASLTLSDEGVRRLVVAIKAEGGALRALEELAVLQNEGSRLDPLLEALTSGEAPCARTLRGMEIGGASTYSLDAVASFFTRGLGMGRLPLLSKLVLYQEAASPESWARLIRALSTLAERGTQSRLETLTMNHSTLKVDCLDALTPVFAAGGLPRLTHLEIGGDTFKAHPSTSFPEAWAKLGDKIWLEGLTLMTTVSRDLVVRIRDAIIRLAFCPYLRRIYLDMNVNLGMNAIDVRKMRRDLVATMEGRGLTPLEFVARLDAAEAPLRAEEIKERRTSCFSKPASAGFQQMDSDGDY